MRFLKFLVLTVVVASLLFPATASGTTRVLVRTAPYDDGSICFSETGDLHVVDTLLPGDPAAFGPGCYRGTVGPAAAAWNGLLAVRSQQLSVPPPTNCVDLQTSTPVSDEQVCQATESIYFSASNVYYRPPEGGTLTVTSDVTGQTQFGTVCVLIRIAGGGTAAVKCDTFDQVASVGVTKAVNANVLLNIRAYISAVDSTGPGHVVVRSITLTLESP